MAIPNFTSEEEALLHEVAQAWKREEFPTKSQVIAQIENHGASFRSDPRIQSARIGGGAITIERYAQVNHVVVLTEGDAVTDTLTTINATPSSPFKAGDILFVGAAKIGKVVIVAAGGNLSISSAEALLSDLQNTLALKFDGTNFVEFGRYPMATTLLFAYGGRQLIDNSAGVGVLTASTDRINAYYVSGVTETRATAIVSITATGGSSGSLDISVDDTTAFLLTIAQVEYSSATTPAAQGIAASAAINAGTATHGYTATDDGAGNVTITAPAGTGSSANTWQANVGVSGGMSATGGAFGGGVDASEANIDLDTIFGGVDGKLLILKNDMATNAIRILGTGNISAKGYLIPQAAALFEFDGAANKWVCLYLPNTPYIAQVSSNYSAFGHETIIEADTSGGNIVITPPLVSNATQGAHIGIKKTSALNLLNFTPAEGIDGVGTLIVAASAIVYASTTEYKQLA